MDNTDIEKLIVTYCAKVGVLFVIDSNVDKKWTGLLSQQKSEALQIGRAHVW
jgi:hypothetical protein